MADSDADMSMSMSMDNSQLKNDSPRQDTPNRPDSQHSQNVERVQIHRLRRNGQRQSCEPCRLSKLRCDHESPCSRCVRRNKTCYFHPAPMSRARVLRHPISLPTPPSPPRRFAAPPNIAASNSSATSPPYVNGPPSSAAGSQPSPRGITSPAGTNNTGNGSLPTPSADAAAAAASGWPLQDMNGVVPMLSPYFVVGSLSSLLQSKKRTSMYVPRKEQRGSTSNASMLLENRALLHCTDWSTGSDTTTGDYYEDAVRLGTHILAWWPSRHACEKITARYLSMTGSATTFKPLYLTFMERLYDTYGYYLEEPRTYSKLERLSRELCCNTTPTRNMRPESSRAWIDSVTGPRSRWEMIGLFFLYFGAMTDLLHDREQVFRDLCPNAHMTREEYAIRTLECADTVRFHLVDTLDPPGNLLCVLLRSKASNRLAHGSGESSSQIWVRAGALIAAATEHDLHRPPSVGSQPALILTELQKRIFSSAFGTACTLAAFHGRPPLITRFYINSELPLDCTDEQLLNDDLEGIHASTNAEGWRLDGHISLATLSRATAISNIFREEILELSLGQRLAPEEMTTRVESLRSRSEAAWSAIPVAAKLPLVRESIPALGDECTLPDVAGLQLRWAQNTFLLERIAHPAQDKARHIAAARRMLSDVVSLWSMRDRFPDNMDDVRWWIANNGIASFSSLGVDLYQQVTNPSAAAPGDAVHRARDITTLAKFGACLEWIDPRDGNYTLCQNANKMLQAVLERVLAPPEANEPLEVADASAGTPSLGAAGAGGGGVGGGMDASLDFDLATVGLADVPAFGVDFHDWFNSDWAMPYTGQNYGGLEI